jgi:hypothetical protein
MGLSVHLEDGDSEDLCNTGSGANFYRVPLSRKRINIAVKLQSMPEIV